MDRAEEILACREERSRKISALAEKGNLFTVKANVPGEDKRLKEACALVRHYARRLTQQFGGEVFFQSGADGYFAIVSGMNVSDAQPLKDFAIKLEEETSAGRFIDIDLIPKGGKNSLSRGYMRRCFLCNEAAFVCARRGAHTSAELLSALKEGAKEYFTRLLSDAVKESMLAELNLENKFGLVSPSSSGSHKDIDYAAMERSQDVIIPGLLNMFRTGFSSESAKGLLSAVRPEGIKTEKQMFAASGGVNTYKGLVFVLGIILACAGYAIGSGKTKFSDISEAVKCACRGVSLELDEGGVTAGAAAYRRYKITGVRGNAESGFPAAFEAEKMIDDDYSAKSLMNALCYIVGNTDDTVLLKRCGSREKYNYYRQKISSADTADAKAMEILNAECLQNNISIGGSADILVAAILLKKIDALWYFE